MVVVDPSAAEAGVTSSGRGVELGHIQAAESCQSVAEYCLTEAKAPDSRSKHNYDTITSEALVGLRGSRGNRLEKSRNSARSYNQWKADILETSQFASDGGVETSRQTNYKSKDVQSDRPKAISPSQPSLEMSQSSAKMHPQGRASLQAFSPMNSNSLLTAWVSVVTLHKVPEEAKFSPPPAWK
ncbi:uncharacterized protein PADG_11138 [Paracoccidioides brasiliensis Pb18]|uniref:Uncharacterized protein n=1 Tax=Paracoccidioides brasiliensis (strain Pb18) TaxID=502780 RepID=A0A0A0HX88_PARBD|nr:uncharacterized protein PADG_11138 [Paracoccidioides brasiliensis Pb18]KGM92681.1 hypothetical protein PADG_11138 [Paracoccidioides brasiliensis Pb18]